MPELPEVETARSLIAGQALHRRIVGVDDADTFVCRPHTPGQLRAALTGRTLTSAQRRGKTMWCETSGLDGSAEPGPELGIHLGMGGRIIVTTGGQVSEGGGRGPGQPGAPPGEAGAPPRKAEWNRFSLEFADGGSLVLFDKRRLGRIRLNPDTAALGPDAERVTPAEFRQLIMKGTVAVKARLLDQSKLAASATCSPTRRCGGPRYRRRPRSAGCSARTPTGSTARCRPPSPRPSPRAACTPARSSRPGGPAGPARAAAPRCGTGR